MTEAPDIGDPKLTELSALVALERELNRALDTLDRLKLLGDVTIELPILLEMTVELINQRTAVQTAIAAVRSGVSSPSTTS